MPPIEPAVGPPPAAGTVPISALANITPPTALGRTTGGVGPVLELTPAQVTTLIQEANGALQLSGAVSAGMHGAQPRVRAALLPDANATIEPAIADRFGVFVLLGPLTANRVLTFTDNATDNTLIFQVVVLDLTAFTYTMQRSTGPTVLYTKPASPPVPKVYQFYKTGSVWTANTQWWSNG